MLGIQPWDLDIGHNFKNMAHVIARHNRVLYVNRPLDRITKWKAPEDTKTKNRLNSIKYGIKVLEEVETNLWVFNPQTTLESINWLPHNAVYKKLNRLNNRRLAKQIKIACDKLTFSNPILFIDNDFYNGLYLPQFLKPDLTLYYLRDYLLAQPYFNKHGKYAEPELISKVDLVITNSLYLNSYAKKYNQFSFYAGQGCGPEFFVPAPEQIPSDLRSISNPVIGYCGFLTTMRLDMDLIYKLASERINWNFVFIGPEDSEFRNSKLHQMPNVFFLGNKPATELPDYVHYFDVCLNPQLINQLTIGNYPRKVDEYLAVGKPVVATRTETMEAFSDSVYLCDNFQDYLVSIEKALASGSDSRNTLKRIEVAKSHSWENSVGEMYKAIKTFRTLNIKHETVT